MCVLWALGVVACAKEPYVEPQWQPTQPTQPMAELPFQSGWATYYASRFAGRVTANGERYDPGAMTAAHRRLPFGTYVKVHRADGRTIVVRINDRGPYVNGRILDLSHRAAEALGMIDAGKMWVDLSVLVPQNPPQNPATMASGEESGAP
ncbi:MAG TPA: septal ring lytic transglycosylase RlpA family protein [Polyangiaceae bacterium]|jgi:rare lipoprotein A